MNNRTKEQYLLGIFLGMLCLLNFPVLGWFNKPIMLGGLPLLFVYLFGLWLLMIGIIYWVIRKSKLKQPDE